MTSGANHGITSDAESGWLMYHSVGRFPGQASQVSQILSQAALDWYDAGEARWAIAGGQRARAMELFATLIGASAETIFTAENVTLAFAAFMTAAPSETLRGRKVLIAADCFPSIHFLLAGLAPRLEFELVTVPVLPGDHYVRDETFIEAWGDDVALAVVTWITSTSSKRADLDRLVAHGRQKGSLIAVDITQGVGLVPFSVGEVDFAASTALKWLCGMPGAGFGYIAPHLIQHAEPVLRGWFSQPPPLNWDLDRFSFADDARRFGSGTPSMLPYISCLPGLEWVRRQAPGAILNHNRLLCDRLLAIADAHDLCVVTPRNAGERGGSVMVAMPDEQQAESLRAGLTREGLVCDRRGLRVRWSPGAVTTMDMLDHMAAVLPGLLGQTQQAAARRAS